MKFITPQPPSRENQPLLPLSPFHPHPDTSSHPAPFIQPFPLFYLVLRPMRCLHATQSLFSLSAATVTYPFSYFPLPPPSLPLSLIPTLIFSKALSSLILFSSPSPPRRPLKAKFFPCCVSASDPDNRGASHSA